MLSRIANNVVVIDELNATVYLIQLFVFCFIDQIRADFFSKYSLLLPYTLTKRTVTDRRVFTLQLSTLDWHFSLSKRKKLFHFPRFCNRFGWSSLAGVCECCTGRCKRNIHRRGKRRADEEKKKQWTGFWLFTNSTTKIIPSILSFHLSRDSSCHRHLTNRQK